MKTSLKLTIIALFFSLTINAQVPNGDFEMGYNIDSTFNNWSNMVAFAIDLTDSVLMDGPLYSLSSQARTGNYALELRNMFNVTQNLGYQGGIAAGFLDTSTTFQTFRFLFAISSKPDALSFYYRFTQNPFDDSTFCRVRILNSNEEIIGEGTSLVWDVNSAYQQKLTSIQYDFSSTTDTIPAFATIVFGNRITTAVPHVGQRILIDDISFHNFPTTTKDLSKTQQLLVAPNPAHTFISVSAKGITFSSCEILNSLGQVLIKTSNPNKIDISKLPSVSYYIRVFEKEKIYIQKWIKQ